MERTTWVRIFMEEDAMNPAILVHNADEKLAYGSAQSLLTEGADFSIAFEPSFSPGEVKFLMTALADYYRACGGAGLELDFDMQEAPAREPVHA